jgi:hypothetical protein
MATKTSNEPEGPTVGSDVGSDVAEVRFEFECPRTWDTLAPTAAPSIRHCDDCDKPVHLSRDVKEANKHARLGRCVAVPTMTASPRRSWRRRAADRLATMLRTALARVAHVLGRRTAHRVPAPPPPPPPIPFPMKTGTLRLFGDDEPPPRVGWLVALDGPQQGRTLRLCNGVTAIGAGSQSHIRLEAAGVAKEHCRIVVSPTAFVLHDGGSKLGTLVDGRRVDEKADLVDGQVIAIAGAQLVFKCIM